MRRAGPRLAEGLGPSRLAGAREAKHFPRRDSEMIDENGPVVVKVLETQVRRG